MRQLRQLRCGQRRGGHERQPPFAVGSQVEHAEWGVGDVQRYDDDQVVVLFESVGYKTLGVELVLERGLLTQA